MTVARLITTLLILVCLPLPSHAQTGNGTTLLTITGKITNTNREPFDDFADAYFGAQEVEFKDAFELDQKSLEALGTTRHLVSYPDWPKRFEFEGPLLRDVLAAAGAKGSTLIVRALDGYAPEIPVADTEKYPVILALKRDGKYLGLGGYGPIWVIYPRDDYDELKDEDDSKFVWAVYHIEVR